MEINGEIKIFGQEFLLFLKKNLLNSTKRHKVEYYYLINMSLDFFIRIYFTLSSTVLLTAFTFKQKKTKHNCRVHFCTLHLL